MLLQSRMPDVVLVAVGYHVDSNIPRRIASWTVTVLLVAEAVPRFTERPIPGMFAASYLASTRPHSNQNRSVAHVRDFWIAAQ